MILALECRVLWLLINSTEHEFFRYFFSYYYTYENLTTSFLAQPVYIGSFIVLSNIFCLSFINIERNRLAKWLYILAIFINTFFLFQLSARSSLSINMIVIIFFTSFTFSVKKKLGLGILFITAFLVTSVFLFTSSGFTKLRMQLMLTELTSNSIEMTDPKSRLLIWPYAVKIIEDNWILGVGTGDAEQLLLESYKKHKLEELYKAQLNAHNQYLTLMMRHGLLGLFVIIINIVFPLWIYMKNRNVEAFLFICLIAVFFLTENVLGRAQGVIFFSLFHSIYLTVDFDNQEYENISLWNQLLSRAHRDR
jgi:O-antigen ligase